MIKINTNFKVTVKIENVLPDGKTTELYLLKKVVMSIKRLKEAIPELFNASLAHIHKDIEQEYEGDKPKTLMTS